jgi:phosphoglycerate kinase
MNKKTIRDIDLAGKRVLVRVDFNVPIEDGKITDDTRITAALPTLQAILAQKPKSVALMSHLGRPKGGPDPKFTLRPVAIALQKLLEKPVIFIEEIMAESSVKQTQAAEEGSVILLENTRFYPAEEKNDAELAKALARYGDVYVNDAFGSAHRAHSSTEAVAKLMPAVAGLLMEKELDYLVTALEQPKRPLVAVLGGAKVSDKIKVIESLLSKADKVLIGGGMANTFFKARGLNVAKSLVEDSALETAKALMAKAGDKLVLPIDVVIADNFADDAKTKVQSATTDVPEGWSILDVGPKTAGLFAALMATAKTVVWNGPMGAFEMSNFARATNTLAQALAEITGSGVITIIGGGDSAAAVNDAGLGDKMTHISTGGGASLELLEGRVLPGVVALNDK